MTKLQKSRTPPNTTNTKDEPRRQGRGRLWTWLKAKTLNVFGGKNVRPMKFIDAKTGKVLIAGVGPRFPR